ncbi:MAG: hypothetical protein RLZZ568_1856 [Cyanobacteriota bacterium]|jgi:hypothetical protein
MKPQFATAAIWEQADCLMQPALIRTIDQLRQALETLPWRSHYEAIQDPIPGHQLVLENGDRLYRINLWDLCFQVCFVNYRPRPFVDNLPDNYEPFWVEIDQTLFCETTIDWTALDQKAQTCIQRMIAALPPVDQSP